MRFILGFFRSLCFSPCPSSSTVPLLLWFFFFYTLFLFSLLFFCLFLVFIALFFFSLFFFYYFFIFSIIFSLSNFSNPQIDKLDHIKSSVNRAPVYTSYDDDKACKICFFFSLTLSLVLIRKQPTKIHIVSICL